MSQKSLRELMTDRIYHYGWLDPDWSNSPSYAYSSEGYREWLNTLDDSHFLDNYDYILREMES